MTSLLSIMQNAVDYIEEKGFGENLAFEKSLYNMRAENKSTFIDIGSGFGKPVFHAAF